MNKILRIFAILIVIAGMATPVSAKKVTFNLKGRPTTGVNGLDYMLQRKFTNDTFPEEQKGWTKHIFFSGGAGVSLIGEDFTTLPKPGFRGDFQIGTWITPVHGVRLDFNYGNLSVHKGIKNPLFGGVHADYMLNISSLLRGYDPNRIFELIGTVGVEYQRFKQNGIWGQNMGIGASLQMRFNAGTSNYIFLEPRLSVLAGDRYDGNFSSYDKYRFHTDVSLNLGIGYKILSGRMREKYSSPFTQSGDDNLFFGLSGGLWALPSGEIKMSNHTARAYFGKKLNYASAIQATLAYGEETTDLSRHKFKFSVASIDYVLNLDNLAGGYRPNKAFNLLFNIGAGAAFATTTQHHTYSPTIGAGLTGVFKFTHNIALTIHPQIYAFNRSFYDELSKKRNGIITVDVGMRYTIGDFSRLHPESFEEFASARNWFVEGGGGYIRCLRGFTNNGGNIYAAIGKRFTPVSSWRASIVGDHMSGNKRILALNANIDYLSSITTAMCGFDPDRIFDLQMLVGGIIGLTKYNTLIKPAYGIKTGLQGNFRLSDRFDIYVEPEVLTYRFAAAEKIMSWTPEIRINLGLRYRLGATDGGKHITGTPFGDGQNFVGLACGPATFSRTMDGRNYDFSPAVDITVGRWLNHASGIRAVYSSNWIKHGGKTKYLGSLHGDYLLDLINLLEPSNKRKFHIIGALGVGVASCESGILNAGFMTYGGVQFRYNLPRNIDVHIEPGANFWVDRVMPGYLKQSSSFTMAAQVAAGVSYRF